MGLESTIDVCTVSCNWRKVSVNSWDRVSGSDVERGPAEYG